MTSSAEGAAIDIRDLRVDYGDFNAVDDVTMTVPYGEVFGLVGPNGAGKTSTFRVLATLMEPTYGEVRLAGIDIAEETESARRVIGYMPDLAPVPSDLKVWEFLDFHAETHALRGSAKRARIDECLETVELADKRNDWCKALSRGQTQRVVLAKTLLHRPKVLILDEPASGLDPLARRDLRITLQNLAAEGATMIVSSHILSELSEMCSSLCIMNKGRLLASGSADEVRRALGRSERTITATVLDGREKAIAWLGEQEGVHDIAEGSNGDLTFGFKGSDDGQAGLLSGLVGIGVRVRTFNEKSSTFEELLVEVAEQNRTSP